MFNSLQDAKSYLRMVHALFLDDLPQDKTISCVLSTYFISPLSKLSALTSLQFRKKKLSPLCLTAAGPPEAQRLTHSVEPSR